MNDGTAMVMFTLFFNMHMDWVNYDVASVIGFFAKMTVAAPLLGIFVGFMGYMWMSSASRKYSHSDSTIQTTITIGIAYLSFYIAEREIQMSGVLATISAALVLAKYVWPRVANPESLESVWHAFEHIGNTLIFFIAGVLGRRALWNDILESTDFGWCTLTYVVMMLTRAVMMVLCYPLLKRIGYGTAPKDAGFMVWGGLRGAVGLALAVFVRSALIQADPAAASQIFFMVAGLAFLTLLINATTSGPVLKKTGMVGISKTKRILLEQASKRLVTHAEEEYCKACIAVNHDAIEVVDSFSELRNLSGTDEAHPLALQAAKDDFLKSISAVSSGEIVTSLETKLASYNREADQEQVKALRESFMRIVRAKYWELIATNKLPKSSSAALLLLNSTSICINNVDEPLHDWDSVEPSVQVQEDGLTDKLLTLLDRVLPKQVTWDNDLHYHLKAKYSEQAYHAAIAFMRAHAHAQQKIASFFGETVEADTPEEITVLLESARQVVKAQNRISFISSMLIKLIKSSAVGAMVVDSLCEYIQVMVKEGVLTEAESEEMLHRLEHEKHMFDKMIKARSRDDKKTIMKDIKRASTSNSLSNSFDKVVPFLGGSKVGNSEPDLEEVGGGEKAMGA